MVCDLGKRVPVSTPTMLACYQAVGKTTCGSPPGMEAAHSSERPGGQGQVGIGAHAENTSGATLGVLGLAG